MMNRTLRNIIFFGDIFFLLLFIKLIDIFFNIGPHHQQIIYELCIIAPKLIGRAVILEQNVLFFKCMVKDDPCFFGVENERVIYEKPESTESIV